MSLKEILMEDLKDSMKNKDTIRKNTITMVRAAIKQEEVDNKKELSEDEIITIINKQLKEVRHSISEFEKGNRQDLVDKSQSEVEVLLKYLPKQLTENELREIVRASIEEAQAESMKDMGKIMAIVMPKIKGMADGSMVNTIIKEYFN